MIMLLMFSSAVSVSACSGSLADGSTLGGAATPAARLTAERSSVNAANTGAAPGKAAEAFTASATPGNHAYKVGALDVLDISVFKAPELSKSVQVADSGTINLPLINDVQVVGRTAQEIERDIAAKLGANYLQKPQVTVYVKEYNSQRVTVEGAVKKPGVFPVRGIWQWLKDWIRIPIPPF
jgi:polysaccharide biosynthesis/export protein